MIKRLKQWVLSLFKKQVVEELQPKKQIVYSKVDYKTELQIVFKNQQVVCTDRTGSFKTSDEFSDEIVQKHADDDIQSYIYRGYSTGILHTFDKSNKYNTVIPVVDIHKILYKPCTIVKTEIKNDNQN
jgi:hypothetical protein